MFRIKNKTRMGSVFCISAACFWGLSGATGQYLFKNTGMTPEWLVATRMLISGLFLLIVYQVQHGGVFQIWMKKQDRIDILLFSLIGLLFTQYGYFASINYCNPATATILQYLAPVMIVVYLSIRYRKMPTKIEVLAVLGALFGTFLLATHGNIHSLSISPLALFWGLLSGVALAFYTVYPTRLLSKYNTMLLIGWAMLIGSVAMNFVHPVWECQGNWDIPSFLCLGFTIIFGTMLAYFIYLDGIRYIGPTKSSLYAATEPLASTIVSVIWLKTKLELVDYIGFIFIVGTVLMLSLVPAKKEQKKESPQS